MTPPRRDARPVASGRPQKHSVTLAGHRTSLSIEPEFWSALCDIARARNMPVARLIAEVDVGRGDQSLSGALRVFVLKTLQPGRG